MRCYEWWLGFWLMFSIWFGILWTILLVCKVDGAVDWSWFYIFIPLWVGGFPNLFLGSWVLYSELRYSYKTKYNDDRWMGAVVWLWICGIGLAIFTVLLVIKLEAGKVPWWGVFIPLWVSLLLLSLIDENWPHFKYEYRYPMWRSRWGWDSGYKYESYRAMWRILPPHFIMVLIVFTVLLVLDLEGVYSTPWVLKLIPFWWLIGLVWLIVFTGISINPKRFDYMVIYPVLTVSIPMVFLLLLGLYLSGVIETYLAIVWIPFWIVEFVALFLAMGICCLMGC